MEKDDLKFSRREGVVQLVRKRTLVISAGTTWLEGQPLSRQDALNRVVLTWDKFQTTNSARLTKHGRSFFMARVAVQSWAPVSVAADEQNTEMNKKDDNKAKRVM